MALPAAYHGIMHHRDDGPEAGLDDVKLHRVIVFGIFAANHPAHALGFDLAEEIHPVIGEIQSRLEQSELARTDVAIGAVPPAFGPGAPGGHSLVEAIGELYGSSLRRFAADPGDWT